MTAIPRSSAAALALILVASCGRVSERAAGPSGGVAEEEPLAPATPAWTAAAVAPEGADRPAQSQVADPCDRITAQYDELIAAPSSLVCSSDAECSCYPGGIGKAGCGGVASRAAAEKLVRLHETYRATGCSLARSCGKTACRGACVQARCLDAQLVPRPTP